MAEWFICHRLDKERFYSAYGQAEAWKFARWRTYSDVYDVMVLADVQKKYPEMYRKCLKTVRKNALTAFKAPVSHHNRLRAVVMMLCPKMIPWMMLLRRKKYHAEI